MAPPPPPAAAAARCTLRPSPHTTVVLAGGGAGAGAEAQWHRRHCRHQWNIVARGEIVRVAKRGLKNKSAAMGAEETPMISTMGVRSSWLGPTAPRGTDQLPWTPRGHHLRCVSTAQRLAQGILDPN